MVGPLRRIPQLGIARHCVNERQQPLRMPPRILLGFPCRFNEKRILPPGMDCRLPQRLGDDGGLLELEAEAEVNEGVVETYVLSTLC